MEISYYNLVSKVKEQKATHILSFLNDVKNGRWEDIVIKVRAETDKVKQRALKAATLPAVTLSGTFSQRSEKSLISHSGFIQIDFDNIEDISGLEAKLAKDEYIFSYFRSCSGNGVCAVVKIKPDKHKECFRALADYFHEQYGEIVDDAPQNVASCRFVSFDPNLYLNEEAKTWTKSPKIKAAEKKAYYEEKKITTTQTDFEYVIRQIQETGRDITGDYSTWRRIGFAIAEHFGAGGEEYFHVISEYSDKYDFNTASRQYKSFLNGVGRGGTRATLASVFYLAKEAGINIVNPDTARAKDAVKYARIRGASPSDAKKAAKHAADGMDDEQAEEIVQAVYSAPMEAVKTVEQGDIEALETFLNTKYKFRRNEITEKIEIAGENITDNKVNAVWVDCCKSLGKTIKKEHIQNLINSDCVAKPYNPIEDFIKANKNVKTGGLIDKLIESVPFKNGLTKGDFNPIAGEFIKKWFVSMFSYMNGDYSPLVLVLTGSHGCGKSHFFRHLLPEGLSDYFAETSMEAGKDDLMLMHSKLLILNDEFGGKTVAEATRFKEIVSKNWITYRKPYGREDITKKRIALFCGASNDMEVINDGTGNRRIIALSIDGQINQGLYNSIDKTALFMEAYKEFKNGYDYKILSSEIEQLNAITDEHTAKSTEEELVVRYFQAATKFDDGAVFMSNSDILGRISDLNRGVRLSKAKLGRALNLLGFESEVLRVNGIPQRGRYLIEKINADVTEV